MLNFILPELSPTAGSSSDGVVVGSVAESLLNCAFEVQTRCLNPAVYRLDRSSGSLTIVNDTTDAISGVSNQWKPFGASAVFSNGDEFIVACDEEIQAILFNVTTAASHSATLHVYDSTDGVWATNELTVTDESSGFELTGWHYITIPANASRAAWKPSYDPSLNIPAKHYIRFRLDGIVGGNTPPQCSQIILVRKTFRYEEHTTDTNGATNTAPPADNHYPWPGSIWQWCFDNRAYGVEVYMHLAASNVITDEHEYLASDSTWKTLSNWVNGTNDFTAGPTVLGNPVEKFAIRWSVPTDWASMAQTITLDDGSAATRTGYWIRERTVTVSSYGVRQNPRYRIRARQFGNANTTGIEMRQNMSVLGISVLSATVENTTTCVCQVANMTTGATASFTIPANPALPLNVDTTDLIILAGQRLGIVCSSGGTLQNCQLALIG